MFWPMFFAALILFGWLLFNHGAALVTSLAFGSVGSIIVIALVQWTGAIRRRKREARHP